MALSLEQALYRAIVGANRYTLATEGRDVRRMTAEIERAIGGKSYSDAARALGVPRTTWRNWRRGSTPKPAAFELLRAAQRRARLSARREAFLRGRPAVRLYAEVQISGDTRDRVLRISTWSVWDARDRFNPILDAWLAMDDARAVELLLDIARTEIGWQIEYPLVYDLRVFKTESLADHWAEGL